MKKKKPVTTGKIVLKVILLIVLLILLAILSVIAYFTAKLDLIQYDHEIETSAYEAETLPDETAAPTETEAASDVNLEGLEQVETMAAIPEGEVEEVEDVVNILVLGTDERTKAFSEAARSDAMILVSIDKNKNTVKLVSLERGMGVPILEGQHAGNYDILTHIFRYGGADLVVKTVREVLKVDVDHYVRFNFYAVKEVVDVIGGIDMDLTALEAQTLNYILNEATTSSQKALKEGTNHLDGGMTLAFARLRSIDSDWQRVERQRKVIIAVVQALKGSSVTDLNNLLDECLPMIQTDLTKLEIAELMLYAPNLLNAEFDQMTIPKKGTYGGAVGLNGQGMFAPDYELNSQILYDFLYAGEETEETAE